ncbi:MAG: hypothetical protein MHM6MM_000499 [Cercozoa sp. M6MM]
MMRPALASITNRNTVSERSSAGIDNEVNLFQAPSELRGFLNIVNEACELLLQHTRLESSPQARQVAAALADTVSKAVHFQARNHQQSKHSCTDENTPANLQAHSVKAVTSKLHDSVVAVSLVYAQNQRLKQHARCSVRELERMRSDINNIRSTVRQLQRERDSIFVVCTRATTQLRSLQKHNAYLQDRLLQRLRNNRDDAAQAAVQARSLRAILQEAATLLGCTLPHPVAEVPPTPCLQAATSLTGRLQEACYVAQCIVEHVVRKVQQLNVTVH